MPFLDRAERRVVYTRFRDEVLGVREEAPVLMPSMTGEQQLAVPDARLQAGERGPQQRQGESASAQGDGKHPEAATRWITARTSCTTSTPMAICA